MESPQFPPQRETAKCIRRLLTVESHQPFGKQFLTQRFHFPTALHPSRDKKAMHRLRRTSHTRRPHGTARLFHRRKLWRQEMGSRCSGTETTSEEALVRASRRGNQQAIETLFRRYQRQLL